MDFVGDQTHNRQIYSKQERVSEPGCNLFSLVYLHKDKRTKQRELYLPVNE